jgi:PKD repeat protein
MRGLLVWVFSLCLFVSLFGQETRHWYFGIKAGLDFSTSPPTVLTGSLSTYEGCSSISDAGGNLLFYTDGTTVWNSAHQVMANGTGLMGDLSSTQSALIIRQPGSMSLYYVFTVWPPNGFRYSVVDMTLASGMGSVSATKNILLTSNCSEALTAVRHCNGTDIWVLIHETLTSNFRAYVLTPTGVSASVVTTSLGPVQHIAGIATMKFSPNGRRLAIAMNDGTDELVLYSFDPSSGAVTNSLSLGTGYYGLEFSPDGSKLFATTIWSPGKVRQWDLCAGNATAIVASEYAVFTQTTVSMPSFGMAQLASDGRIYVSRSGDNSLAVIKDPNVYGAGCNFTLTGQTVAPNSLFYGLPGFVTNLIGHIAPPFGATVSCLDGTLLANPAFTTNLACTASNYSVLGIQWDFGDPLSGAMNSSTLTAPFHQFTSPGTYTVKLAYATACGADTLRQLVIVGAPPQMTLVSTPSLCAGSSATLHSVNFDNLNWYTSANSTSVIASGSAFVTPTLSTGSYTFHVALPTCTFSSARLPHSFSVYALPTVSVSPKQPTVCAKVTVTLTAAGAASYTWSTQQQTTSIILTPSTSASYWVVGKDINGCTDSAVAMLTVSPCLGIRHVTTDDFRFYPTPARSELVIETASALPIRIYDISGSLLLKAEAEAGKNTFALPLGMRGVYILSAGELHYRLVLE